MTGFQSGRTPTAWVTRGSSARRRCRSSAWPARSSSTSPTTSGARSSTTHPAIRASTARRRAAGNLYRRDPDGSKHTLTSASRRPRPPISRPGVTYGGGSPNLSLGTYSFNQSAARSCRRPPGLTRSPGVTNAYMSTGHHDVVLVSVLPNGTASPTGGTSARSFGTGFNAVSDNGSRVFWSTRATASSTCGSTGRGPCRSPPTSATTPIPNGVQPKNYQYATPDGSVGVLLQRPEADQQLAGRAGRVPTSTATTSPAGRSPTSRPPIRTAPASRAWSASTTAARASTSPPAARSRRARPTARPTSTSATAPADALHHRRSTRSRTRATGAPDGPSKTGRVTPNGSTMLFSSRAPQLGYDNAGHLEFYVYDLASDSFQCISCVPNGDPATSDAVIDQPPRRRVLVQRLPDVPAPQPVRRRLDGVLHLSRSGWSAPTRTASTTPICGRTGSSSSCRAARAPTTPPSSTHRRAATTPSS